MNTFNIKSIYMVHQILRLTLYLTAGCSIIFDHVLLWFQVLLKFINQTDPSAVSILFDAADESSGSGLISVLPSVARQQPPETAGTGSMSAANCYEHEAEASYITP